MEKSMRTTTLAVVLGLTFNAFAASSVQEQSLDPVVQHLKLSKEQVAKIQVLHQQLADNVAKISLAEVNNGAIINIIRSGKWNDSVVKKQLTVFSSIDQQSRYYKVKYYFDLNQVLTPEQRQQVRVDLAKVTDE